MTTAHRSLVTVVVGIALLPGTALAQMQITSYLRDGGADVITPAAPSSPLTLSSPLSFNFTVQPGGNLEDMLAGNQGPEQQALGNQVVQGFQDGADLWRAQFVDPITVNVTIEFAALGAGILGSTTNNTDSIDYANIRTALINDAITADDTIAASNLQPSGAGLDFLTNDTSVVPSPVLRDADGSANNVVLNVPRANAKALGQRAAHDPAEDGAIAFSNSDQFQWDFDRSDGITLGSHDFLAVSAHEVGHLMGFVSGVDAVDSHGGDGPDAPQDLSDFSVFSVLDLYRYSTDSLAEDPPPPLPTNGTILDLSFGGTPFFSIDAGATNLATFSTGTHNGDGWQASHWTDDGLGLMDPTLARGELGVITALDFQSFDVIGWNPVPEPGSMVLAVMALAGLFALARLRRHRAGRNR